MRLKHVLRHFSKTNSEDLLFPRPLREREELLSEQSELSNSGEGCKDLPSPVAFATQSPKCRKIRHFDKMLKQVQHDNFSCAEHTVKDLSSKRLNDFKKAAFTLAEVLITLGIIGVVAAMTLPTLIQNHQKQTYVNGLKKAISVTSNMLKKMQVDEDASSITATSIVYDGLCVAPPPCEPETECFDCGGGEYCITSECPSNGCEDKYGNPSVFERLVPKYLKVVKICKGDECNIEYKTSCNINAGKYVCDSTKYTMASIPNYDSLFHNVVGFYTADGMIYYFIAGDYKNLSISVDVNGSKGPNSYGRDLFRFGYCMSENGKFSGGDPTYCGLGEVYNTFLYRIIENGWKMDY